MSATMLEHELRRAILCEGGHDLFDDRIVSRCVSGCIAHLAGWAGMYATALMTKHGWRTATRGDLGQGWPDLTLVSQVQRRVLFAELKVTTQPSDHQLAVLRYLREAHQEAYVWTPDELDDGTIWRILRHGKQAERE